MMDTLETQKLYELELQDGDGREYIGRITGTLIAYDGDAQVQVFLTDDERVIAYDEDKREHYELEQWDLVEGLRNLLRSDEAYAEALHALGEKPVRDI